MCEPTTSLNSDLFNSLLTLDVPASESTDDSDSSPFESAAVELPMTTHIADEQRRGSRSVWTRLKRAWFSFRFGVEVICSDRIDQLSWTRMID
jgi:hypothetical protein